MTAARALVALGLSPLAFRLSPLAFRLSLFRLNSGLAPDMIGVLNRVGLEPWGDSM